MRQTLNWALGSVVLGLALSIGAANAASVPVSGTNGGGAAVPIIIPLSAIGQVAASPAPVLDIAASADLDGVAEIIDITIEDGVNVVTIGQVVGGPNAGEGSSALCVSRPAVVVFDGAAITALNAAIQSGVANLVFTPRAEIGAFCGVSGTFTFDGAGATARSTAQGLSATRGALAVANLPSLSGRMGGGGGGQSSSLSGGGSETAGALSFSTSLAALRDAAHAEDTAQGGTALGFHAHPGVGAVDVWVGGAYTYFETDTDGIGSTGDIGSAQIGVDMRVSERLLVGLLAMGDLLKSDIDGGTKAGGMGFLAGPYAVARLSDDIYLEGLAALGMSFNEIDSAGAAAVADYESRRMLLTARVSGDFALGGLSVSPSARLTYYADWQDAFTDGDGEPVPAGVTRLGQLRFGPEFAYQMTLDEDASIRPFVSFEGVYSFLQTDRIVNGATIAPDSLSGTVSAGFDLNIGAAAIRANARYDGAGSDELNAISGEVQVRLPLN